MRRCLMIAVAGGAVGLTGCFNPGGSDDGGSGAEATSAGATGMEPTSAGSTGSGATSSGGVSTLETSGDPTTGEPVTTGEATTAGPSEAGSTGCDGRSCNNVVCGDGDVDLDEACDDGNLTNGDGCDENCEREGWLMFVTSSEHTGDLGGVAGADALCMDLAIKAELPGVYRAWLSTEGQAVSFEILDAEALPYIRIDGTPIALNWNGLVSGTLGNAVFLDEMGGEWGGAPCEVPVWTNTTAQGLSGGASDCMGWTSFDVGMSGALGDPNSVSAEWTAGCESIHCGKSAHLYCVQQQEP